MNRLDHRQRLTHGDSLLNATNTGSALHGAAEAAWGERNAQQSALGAAASTPEASKQALHELQVHQIELEMQNEELRRRQIELDAASKRYFDLYDLAPVGYFTLNEAGTILQTNLTASSMLGTPRSALVKQPFSRFVFHDDMDIYYQVVNSLRKTGTARTIDLRMRQQEGTQFWAQLDTHVVPAVDGTSALRLAMSDISARKQVEQSLVESRLALEALTRRQLEMHEAERRMIARELHDEVGGVLTAVKLNLQTLRRTHDDVQREAVLVDGLVLVEAAIQSVRSLSLDLRPSMLDDLGLIPALKWYCQRQAQRAGVVIALSLDAIDLKDAMHLESACYRIVQESLTNSLRHAQAQRIAVALRRDDGHFLLEISDDGVGFDATAIRTRGLAGESGGLLGMAERVGLLGGRFGVETEPGGGTRVWAEFAVPDGGFV